MGRLRRRRRGHPAHRGRPQPARQGAARPGRALCTRSDEFGTRWGAHNVRHHGTGTKRFHHHAVGDLTVAFEGLELAGAAALTLTVYTAEPGSASKGLRLLASWAATREAAPETERSTAG
ncbi:hypothetical protein SVIOM342S_01258 [Streptomyces violaceorubidus]